MKSGGRRRRESEEKASWLGREALTNIASDKCAFAHLTATRKSAKFSVQGQEMWQRKAGLPFVQSCALRARLPCS